MHILLSMVFLLSPLATAVPADGSAEPSHRGVWPLQPRPGIARGFAPPQVRWGSGHRGVDLVGRAGQRVHTTLGGEVSFAGRLAGRGVVVVRHGAVRTTYEPVHATVSVGQSVRRGQSIGILQRGSSHCFPRACLHWGLLRARTYLNPLTLVGAGPVRLLPLGSWGSAGSGDEVRSVPGVLRLRPSDALARRPGVAVPR